jgi:hypothetical protein
LILSPLDKVRTVLRNIVKSSRFIESVLCPVAPIVGANVAKLGPIAGKMTNFRIIHFYDVLVLGNLLGPQ